MIEPKFLYLSVPEASEALGLTGGRVRQLLIAKELRGHKLGTRSWAIPAAEVERFREERENRNI